MATLNLNNTILMNADPAGTATTAVSAHNTAADAHGFGVYTVAQLNAFTNTNRPTGCVYCSDCLTLEGAGSPVVWNGSKWVETCGGIDATTEYLTFFRAIRASGRNAFAAKTLSYRRAPFPEGPSDTSGNGGVSAAYLDGETIFSTTGSATNGYNGDGGTVFSVSLDTYEGTRALAAVYWANTVYLSALSSAAEEFSVRAGLLPGSYGATLGTREASFVYDRGNVLGIGNTGNSTELFALTRNSSVNTVTATGVTLGTIGTPTVLEVLYTSGNVKFYANSNLVADVSTNVPVGSVSLTGATIIAKSAGTTGRSIYKRNQMVALRYS